MYSDRGILRLATALAEAGYVIARKVLEPDHFRSRRRSRYLAAGPASVGRWGVLGTHLLHPRESDSRRGTSGSGSFSPGHHGSGGRWSGGLPETESASRAEQRAHHLCDGTSGRK